MPNKRKRAKRGALGKSRQQRADQEGFFECPNGHQLPHTTNKGECSVNVCAGNAPGGRDYKLARQGKDPIGPKRAGKIVLTEEQRIKIAEERHLARLKAVNHPDKPLKGADAEEFFDQKMVELLPTAASILEFRLKFGDDDQQDAAAREIMGSTGRSKREQKGGSGSPIIMLVNPQGGPVQNPFLRRVEPEKLAEGEKK